MAEVEYPSDALIVDVASGEHTVSAHEPAAYPPRPRVARGTRHRGNAQLMAGDQHPGQLIPSVITARTFYQDGGRVFWAVQEVDDPAATIACINGQRQR